MAYKTLVRKPHALSTFGFGMVGRIPLALNPVALVLLIAETKNSFAIAGLASASYTLTGAICGPRIARLADQIGRRKVLPQITVLNALSVFSILVVRHGGTLAICVAAAAAGATFPNFGSNAVSTLAVAKAGNRGGDGGLLVALCTTGIIITKNLDSLPFWLVLSGFAIAPALIAGNAFLRSLVAKQSMTEAFSYLGAAISIGVTIGSAAAGKIVNDFGGWSGFYFVSISAILSAIVGLFGLRRREETH